MCIYSKFSIYVIIVLESKMKKIKGNVILGLGILLVSVSLLLNNVVNDTIHDIIIGIGIGLELLGLIKECKGK